MSVFVLKLIALGSMLTDHLGFFLYPRFISRGVCVAMRAVGRTAFPVYAFLIVNGYRKTHDAAGYLTRLVSFAFLSQLPFTLLFRANPSPWDSGLTVKTVYPWYVCLVPIAAVGLVWFFSVRRGPGALWPVLALTAGVLRVEYDGVRLLGDKLNVFYTLALGLACVALMDSAADQKRDLKKLLPRLLALGAAFFLIRDSADYRSLGVALIASLWLARDSRLTQCAVLLIWCAAEYLLGDRPVVYFLCAALSVPALLLYNGQLGRPLKRVFYLAYPLHLLILGGLTVYSTLV